MKKQKQKNITLVKHAGRVLSLFMLTGLMAASFVIAPFAQGATIEELNQQIQQIQADNSAKQQSVNQLQVQASSYQDAINQLQNQINALQQQIQANQAKRDDLQKQIEAAQAELDKQKALLSESIKAMYVEGQISTLEMLASSKDLSEFLDKQQYRSTIQEKIKDTLDKINALKAQLKEQKTQVETLLAEQQAMNQQLSDAQAQQAQLLAYNQQQQAAYTQQMQANNATIANLRAQQAALYASYARKSGVVSYGVGDAGNGGYPSELANALQDSIIDNWGLYNRECVSYVAWKEANNGAYVPYGLGNAADWVWRAQAAHIPTGTTPRVGAAIVWESNDGLGTLGHVAYVEVVNSDGSVEVSQYNFVHGQFSRMHVPAYDVAHLSFIYF